MTGAESAGPWALVLAALAGVALGGFFFGGLWWTLRRSLASAQPALWQTGSLLLRLAVTLLGFHLVGAGQWPQLLACLAGFVLARGLVLRLTRGTGRTGRTGERQGHAA